MLYSLDTLSALIGAHRFGAASVPPIERLLTDSRSLAFPEATLFFALRTASGDGHRYIPALYRRGVRAFVVDALPGDYATAMPEAAFLRVVSPLRALQRLAERHREEFPTLPVVGITGSNGKTVVKEWLYRLLSPEQSIVRSPRSYNSQVGVPLSVCNIEATDRLALFEAGISQPGEMEALRAIIQPTLGILTNLGAAHQEHFATPGEKCCEKLSLFADAEALVYCADDALIASCLETAAFHGERLAWSRRDEGAYLYVEAVEPAEAGCTLRTRWQGQRLAFALPFGDAASVENALHCITLCLYLGAAPAQLAARLAQLEPIAMRLEVKPGVRGCVLINDSYNSDIHSLDIALDFLARRAQAGGEQTAQRALILSDILQSGVPEDELYRRVAQLVNQRGVQQVLCVGPALQRAQPPFAAAARYFATTDALLHSGALEGISGATVLVKGARPFGFERISRALSQRVHATTLEVNLEALADNLKYYRSFLRPETKLVCMVKASAYGAGAVEVAKTLQERGVDYLAVAVADEGAQLRRAGITTGIIVMNPEQTAFGTLFEYNLEPEVYNFRLLEDLIAAARHEGITAFPVHLKLDTGMHRLGFDPRRDVPQLIDRLRHQRALTPRSVFSHFVGSDSAGFDDFSSQQFALFDSASRTLQTAFSHRILRHICNSAGIERFPERQLDMVRLGLGLYGIDPIDNRTLHNVCTLRTTILQIRDVPAGDSIGYSRRTVVERPSRIAAIPIGYADGLNRHLGNRAAYCLVGGQPAPYVGNICMDVCMIDVTGIPCREGDAVEIFGDALPVTTLSDRLDTIPYEVLTSVSERVKRVYFQG